MFRKNLAIFLIITLALFMFMEGCGKKDGDEAPPAEGEEGAEPADGEVQEASRTAAPAAPPPPPVAAPPKAPVPPKPGKGAPAEKQVNIKSRPVPEDRFLPIEFDTKEAALVTTGQTYAGKIRRNVFRDIKSDSKLRKDAENSISQARKMYDKVKVMPAGSYNEPLLKQADEMLKQGEAAFKDQNYFKAKMMADKSYELAFDAIPRVTDKTDKPTVELLYKGFYQLSEDKTAMLTKKDPETGVEKLFMVQEGSVVAEDLPTAVVIDLPDGTQKKITKIEYKVEQITEEKIVITNITENKPSFSIDISRQSETKTPAAPAGKDAAKTPAAGGGSPFQSNQTTKTGGSSTSGNTMKGF